MVKHVTQVLHERHNNGVLRTSQKVWLCMPNRPSRWIPSSGLLYDLCPHLLKGLKIAPTHLWRSVILCVEGYTWSSFTNIIFELVTALWPRKQHGTNYKQCSQQVGSNTTYDSISVGGSQRYNLRLPNPKQPCLLGSIRYSWEKYIGKATARHMSDEASPLPQVELHHSCLLGIWIRVPESVVGLARSCLNWQELRRDLAIPVKLWWQDSLDKTTYLWNLLNHAIRHWL